LNLSAEDQELLEDAIELSRSRDVRGLYNFVMQHCSEGDLNVLDERLIGKMPEPVGKYREAFIIVCNEFIKQAYRAETYPITLPAMSRDLIHAAVAAHYQCTMRTAGQKVNQLVAQGWIERGTVGIKNPLMTYKNAQDRGLRHPGLSQHVGDPITSQSRDADADRGGRPSSPSKSPEIE
jgi:hypothetical protein